MAPNQDSSSARKRAPLDSLDARQSKARRTANSAPSRPVVAESSADSLLNDSGSNDDGFVFVGLEDPARFGNAPLLGQPLFLPGSDDEVSTVDPALLGHADIPSSNNSVQSGANAPANVAPVQSTATIVAPTVSTAPQHNALPTVSAGAVVQQTGVAPSILTPVVEPTGAANTQPNVAAPAAPSVLALAAEAPGAANTQPDLAAPAAPSILAPVAQATVAGNVQPDVSATTLPNAAAQATPAVPGNAIVQPLAPHMAVAIPNTTRATLMAAALMGLGSTRLEHCNDVLVNRVTGIHRWKEEDRFRYPLSDIPPGATWGPPLPFDKPDELLCAARSASALKFHFVAELSRFVLADRDGSALDQVSINVVPMSSSVRAAAETHVEHMSKPSTTVPVSYWGPGQIRVRTWTSTYGKAPNQFTNIFDAQTSFRPYGGMDRLQVGDLGARDLVIVECQIRRYKIDKKKEETGWHKWIAYHDLLSISLLQKAPAARKNCPLLKMGFSPWPEGATTNDFEVPPWSVKEVCKTRVHWIVPPSLFPVKSKAKWTKFCLRPHLGTLAWVECAQGEKAKAAYARYDRANLRKLYFNEAWQTMYPGIVQSETWGYPVPQFAFIGLDAERYVPVQASSWMYPTARPLRPTYDSPPTPTASELPLLPATAPGVSPANFTCRMMFTFPAETPSNVLVVNGPLPLLARSLIRSFRLESIPAAVASVYWEGSTWLCMPTVTDALMAFCTLASPSLQLETVTFGVRADFERAFSSGDNAMVWKNEAKASRLEAPQPARRVADVRRSCRRSSLANEQLSEDKRYSFLADLQLNASVPFRTMYGVQSAQPVAHLFSDGGVSPQYVVARWLASEQDSPFSSPLTPLSFASADDDDVEPFILDPLTSPLTPITPATPANRDKDEDVEVLRLDPERSPQAEVEHSTGLVKPPPDDGTSARGQLERVGEENSDAWVSSPSSSPHTPSSLPCTSVQYTDVDHFLPSESQPPSHSAQMDTEFLDASMPCPTSSSVPAIEVDNYLPQHTTQSSPETCAPVPTPTASLSAEPTSPQAEVAHSTGVVRAAPDDSCDQLVRVGEENDDDLIQSASSSSDTSTLPSASVRYADTNHFLPSESQPPSHSAQDTEFLDASMPCPPTSSVPANEVDNHLPQYPSQSPPVHYGETRAPVPAPSASLSSAPTDNLLESGLHQSSCPALLDADCLSRALGESQADEQGDPPLMDLDIVYEQAEGRDAPNALREQPPYVDGQNGFDLPVFKSQREGSWTVPMMNAPSHSPTLMPFMDSDRGGVWLCQPFLVGKRVDVVVTQRTRGGTSKRQQDAVGSCGFVELTRPLQFCDLKKKIAVRVGPLADKVSYEPEFLLPMRTAYHPPHLELDVCLSMSPVPLRVIIMGADCSGSVAYIGEYAETIPSARSALHLPGYTAVRFSRWSRWYGLITTVHINALVRSFNVDGVSTSSTIF
ncbi:hypothetical protein R3P38DRAFT_3196026 [Favolaschia claudopus]|uniref:Uncharacterized protein n=1 Tax=Favolaschia claudopus TaxID=2862362 RepID=A0AAW0BBT9_9AGAR